MTSPQPAALDGRDQASAQRSRLSAVAGDLVSRGRGWPPLVPTLVALVLAIWYLAARPVGTDLAAQIARADFARAHPFTPIDLRWFSGTSPFGYSLLAPLAMAWVGVRLTGAICCVLATAQLTVLFVRTSARRPVFAGSIAAILQGLNLAAGRVTFGVGTVCAVSALLTVAPLRSSTVRVAGWRTAVSAFAAGAASPVAALFLWVCAGALALSGRVRDALVIVGASAASVIVAVGLFGSGGSETFACFDARDALLATLVVAIVVPRRPVRIAAVIALVMVIVAYVASTPVGNNSARLSLLFAVPVVAAYTGRKLWVTLVAVAVTAWPEQQVQEHAFSISPGAEASFYTPIAAELEARGPVVGRLEVPETRAHWDTAYLARDIYLARGWLRQADISRNRDLFFSGRRLTEGAYRNFLTANAVQYVAVPDVPLTSAGQKEATLLKSSPQYLHQIWHNADWTLYQVREAKPIVNTPGQLISSDAASLTLRVPAAAEIWIDVTWSSWLYVQGPPGACIARTPDGRVRLQVGQGGTYTVTSGLFPPDTDCA